jgi:hypothetical protein
MARTGAGASNPFSGETELLKSLDLPLAEINTMPKIIPDPIRQRFQNIAVNIPFWTQPAG